MKPMCIMVLGVVAGAVFLSAPRAAQDARPAEADPKAQARRVATAGHPANVPSDVERTDWPVARRAVAGGSYHGRSASTGRLVDPFGDRRHFS